MQPCFYSRKTIYVKSVINASGVTVWGPFHHCFSVNLPVENISSSVTCVFSSHCSPRIPAIHKGYAANKIGLTWNIYLRHHKNIVGLISPLPPFESHLKKQLLPSPLSFPGGGCNQLLWNFTHPVSHSCIIFHSKRKKF